MNELLEMVETVFGDAWDAAGEGLDADLWRTCEETGLARLTLPESAGGSEGSFADAAAVLRSAGRFAARVPLVETDLMAGWLAHAAGLKLPGGPLSAVGPADVSLVGGRATGVLSRVPWGRAVSAVVAPVGDQVVLVTTGAAGIRVVEGVNLAEEPRDDLELRDVPVLAAPLPAGALEEFRLRAALGRSLLLAGAGWCALEMAARYATERVQFGRPIAKLQAVQQMLALAAAEVAAAEASASAAALAADRDGIGGASTAIAAAKARTGEAAGEIARIAHQVHGALGFTREHDLRLATTRLWAWRDEDGAESVWHEQLGDLALAAGPAGIWPLLVGGE
ncbi:acyl-CoA dehydrogenase family protein [Actinomadura bangladeshensis]|uniref:Acyl-CoA dehydrogenase n=1 Tax=Actinomadura bangladeshensis TaxID=453573 RepID=A0A4R4PCZ0_9ACTN|nr:acyl-CoA dehydrogenase family protein [Actinomadura bangladeshensis]TDC20355.1 acyl-CoA dehydrogenase [Actinomadura bangladeshensis]